MNTPDFVPGLELSRSFYNEAVRPILGECFPGLQYSAGLIGSGSEVFGFDDSMSSDHHWGPRVMLFLRPDDLREKGTAVRETLSQQLPRTFRGYSTNFSAPNPDDNGVQHLQEAEHGPVNHRVELDSLAGFWKKYMGFDLAQELTAADWLTFPQQKLAALRAGAVFHDDLGLEAVRARFAWYPRDVWIYLLAACWARIAQEEHLMGRAGSRGDEIGSALIGARLVRDVMRLGFLMEKQYAPYPKWFGTAFQRLACAAQMSPALRNTLCAADWQERERHWVAACEIAARMHNALGLTAALPETGRDFWGRPFRVVAFHGFSERLLEQIRDVQVRSLLAGRLIGSVDLFSDNTDLLENPGLRPNLLKLYEDL